MRIIAFVLIAALGTANITLRRRLPPKNVKGGLLNLAAFRNIPYTLYSAAVCIGFLGIYTGACACLSSYRQMARFFYQ